MRTPKHAYVLTISLTTALLLSAACTPDPKTGTPQVGSIFHSPTAPTLPAGTPTVVISGVVTDDTGAAVGGVTVIAQAKLTAASTTDESGMYVFQPLEIPKTSQIYVKAAKAGYRMDGHYATSVGPSLQINFKLFRYLTLPVDESVSMQLTPDDPEDYVGDAYDSDYSWNTKYFSYATPADSVVTVELSWDHVGNARPMMWAAGGTLVSQASGDRQTIVLPANTTGVMLVGQSYDANRLRQSMPFTLDTHRGR